MAGTDNAKMTAPDAVGSAGSTGATTAPAADPTAPSESAAATASNTTTATVNSAVEAAEDAAQVANDEDENEDDGELVVTLHEVLQEQTELNDAAEAVLGDASDDHCSYELGYYRQALYACLTCTPGPLTSGAVAGVCLACSYHCHGDHELVELYTKRDFRCDCGNARFPETSPCVLMADKDALNERNKYSQNFVGTYCACQRPYPDPERTTPEIMVQCIVCEDWLHEEHIFAAGASDAKLPPAFDELICQPCMAKHAFLAAYQLLEHADAVVEIEDGVCILEKLETRLASEQQAITESPVAAESETTTATPPVQPTFWSREWRTRLCTCSKCVVRMEKQQIAFLVDPEDTLQAYEERAKQQQLNATESSSTTTANANATNEGEDAVVSATVESAMSTMEEAAQRAFQSKLSHEQQVEMAMGYNHMKEKLQTYLATFAASGKTVRAQDIQEFFAELRQTKRQRLN